MDRNEEKKRRLGASFRFGAKEFIETVPRYYHIPSNVGDAVTWGPLKLQGKIVAVVPPMVDARTCVPRGMSCPIGSDRKNHTHHLYSYLVQQPGRHHLNWVKPHRIVGEEP